MRPRPATDIELWCGACKAMHPRKAFGKSSHESTGLANACTDAVAIRNRLSHARNREANNARHHALRAGRKAGPDAQAWAVKHLLADAAGRASARGLAFNLTAENLHQPTHCPIFGCELVYQAKERRQDNSASLDRVDSSRGYTVDNVWVISWRANQIKNDATLDEMKRLVAAMEQKAAGRLLDGVEHNEFP
jgi:hypothetical protein